MQLSKRAFSRPLWALLFLILLSFPVLSQDQGSGKAISFQGNSGYVEVAQDPSLAFNAGDSYTLEAWFKGTGTNNAIISRMNRNNSHRGWDIWVNGDGGVAMHLIHSWSGDALKMSTDRRVDDGEWHHIAVTYDGSSGPSGVNIYVDGINTPLTTENNNLTSTNTTPSVPFTIGCRSDGGGTTQHLDGIVDEVRIWSDVRSQSEVRNNMCRKLSGSEADLQAYYRLDENDGVSTVNDHSGNNNDGTCQSLSTNNDRIFSGASLGVQSSYSYPSSSSSKGIDLAGGSGENVNVPQDPSMEFNKGDAYSLSAWYKGNASGAAILSMMDQSNDYQGWDMWIEGNGTVAMHLINSWSGNALKMSSNTTVNDGAWHHIVVTYDGSASPSGVDIYVDGSNTSLSTSNDNLTNNDTDPDVPFRIGGRSNGSNCVQEIDGKVDEVSIWSKVLSSSYIQDLSNCDTSISGSETDLQAYYDMEGSGATVTDGTSNGNDGSMENMTSSDRVNISYCGASWTGVELYHTSSDGDSLKASNVSGNPEGLHIYSVDTFPNTLNGSSGVGSNDQYYGAFIAGGSNPSYDATYYYRENDAYQNSNNTLDESAMALYKRTDNGDGTWSDAGASLDQNAKTLLATSVNTEFILGNNSSPLPVELLSFDGYQKDDAVLLKWRTASEQNAEHYRVQRSIDGEHWQELGRVDAAGTTVHSTSYQYKDKDPLKGRSYYRLVQVDRNGEKEEYGPIAVRFDLTNEIQLSPNPTSGQLRIDLGKETQEVRISIRDLTGRTVKRQEVENTSTFRTSIEGDAGIYFVEVQTEDGRREVRKVVKE